MKTRVSATPAKKRVLFPVLVKDTEDNSIMLFVSSTKAVLLVKGDCDYDVGYLFEETIELEECDTFVVLPEGYELTLIQSQDVTDD